MLSGENPKATLHECQTVYSIEDLYDLLEIGQVDAHNQHILSKRKPVDG